MLEEKLIFDKLQNILIDLYKNKNKLFLIKEKMSNHSDKNTFSKIQNIIEETLYE